MATHPANLALRFLMELAALVAMGYWGWTQHDGAWRFVLGIGLPLVAAVMWGTFAVPDDPSRSGKAPVPTPGLIRLLLELAFFAIAAALLVASDQTTLGVVLAVVTLVHYALSYDRIKWLLAR